MPTARRRGLVQVLAAALLFFLLGFRIADEREETRRLKNDLVFKEMQIEDAEATAKDAEKLKQEADAKAAEAKGMLDDFRRNTATIRPPLALLLLTILSGCATSGAPSQGSQAVHLSRDCEYLAANVEDPLEAGRITQRTDPKLAAGEYRVALGEANDNIDATRSCQEKQRARLADCAGGQGCKAAGGRSRQGQHLAVASRDVHVGRRGLGDR
jgi:hypothetical protein